MKCPDPYPLLAIQYNYNTDLTSLGVGFPKALGWSTLVLHTLKHILYNKEGLLRFVLSTLLQYMPLLYYDAMSGSK